MEDFSIYPPMHQELGRCVLCVKGVETNVAEFAEDLLKISISGLHGKSGNVKIVPGINLRISSPTIPAVHVGIARLGTAHSSQGQPSGRPKKSRQNFRISVPGISVIIATRGGRSAASSSSSPSIIFCEDCRICEKTERHRGQRALYRRKANS